MDATPLDTPRLRLRPCRAKDRDAFVALNTDPEVRHHMNGALTRVVAEGRFDEILSGEVAQRTCWAVIEKETGAFAGQTSLWFDCNQPYHDLSFLFFKPFWGRGFATETACRLVAHCLRDAGLAGLSATVDCDHTPSISVLKKAGFKKASVGTDEHGPFFIYTIHANQPAHSP